MSRTPDAPPFDARTSPSHTARFLSNGTYVTLVTAAGTGASRHAGLSLTPWKLDGMEDVAGLHFYVRDLDDGEFWTTGAGRAHDDGSDRIASECSPGRVRLTHFHAGIEARLDVSVPPDVSLEVRRLTLVNGTDRVRRLDVTSCAEVVLNDDRAHAAHPVFSKLFLQTAVDESRRLLVVTRRARGSDESHPALFHALLERVPVEWETDRARFLGRGTCVPRAFTDTRPLSGTVGNVLDPITSLRSTLQLAPGEHATLTFVLGVSTDRSRLGELLARLAAPGTIDAAFGEAEAHARSVIGAAGIAQGEAEYIEALAGAALYRAPSLRAGTEQMAAAYGTIDDVAALGLDPARPACVLHAEREAGAALWPLLAAAHGYLHALGVELDIHVMTDDPKLSADVARHGGRSFSPRIERSAAALLDATARIVIRDVLPDLTSPAPPGAGARARTQRSDRGARDALGADPRAEAPSGEPLAFANGLGGFALDGREYVIRPPRGPGGTLLLPPRPWINVIANETFGCLMSETGAGCTWSGNSREHRLTPWHNDPLTDPHGESLYVRDEKTGAYWSPMPGPVVGSGAYEVRHGWGYTTYTRRDEELEEETTVFVPRCDTLKISRIRIRNRGTRARRLSLFAYHRLVLGHDPEDSSQTLFAVHDRETDVLLARNAIERDGGGGLAFAALVAPPQSVTHAMTDRLRFVGRGRTLGAPAALERPALADAREEAGGDACFALQCALDVLPGHVVEVSVLFGTAPDRPAALSQVDAYRRAGAVDEALETVRAFWVAGLSRVRVETPSPPLDTMVNGWAAYQSVACRMWGRSALYQASGAFGFRDQLQDAAAVVHLWPELTRSQILLSAGRQFMEGDVLHWWHPPHDRGLRTRFADDLLWLPYVTASYVRTTGDRSLLEEVVPFLTARRLVAGEDEVLLRPEVATDTGDIYEHCCRAIDRSLTTGAHGLPLFGTGDWNDGMNRVGREGRGESVWMAFFLVFVLERFVRLCRHRGDRERERRYTEHRTALIAAANEAGWDGAWYRRGYYDSGQPLGSSASTECRIDALAQAWAVMSGAAPPERAASAMDAVDDHLVDRDAGIVRLLTPPFEHTPEDPGYIRGYVRGVRENGGQYTHAAMWVVRAMAEIGRTDDAAALLEMMNPITHTQTPEAIARYQVEPYVIAADIYGEPPHVGRGGWTWYTGSSGWMFRVALESILGLRLIDGATLSIAPRIPGDWPGYRVEYTIPGSGTRYIVSVHAPDDACGAVVEAMLDGAPAAVLDGAARIPVVADGEDHHVSVVLGRTGAPAYGSTRVARGASPAPGDE